MKKSAEQDSIKSMPILELDRVLDWLIEHSYRYKKQFLTKVFDIESYSIEEQIHRNYWFQHVRFLFERNLSPNTVD